MVCLSCIGILFRLKCLHLFKSETDLSVLEVILLYVDPENSLSKINCSTKFILHCRAHGPLTPRILKRRKGHRDDGKTVSFIVSKTMTAEMVKNM